MKNVLIRVENLTKQFLEPTSFWRQEKDLQQ